MIITKYISKNIKSITVEETVGEAEQLMIKNITKHLPVTSEGKLIGNISINTIRELDKGKILKDYLLELEQFYLPETSIIFDTLQVFSENETNIIPIIDNQEKFLGAVIEEVIIDEFATIPFITEFGVFMTITTPILKYSMSEIANIVESNNGSILGVVIVNSDEETTQLTLKIRSENINSIGATFERFGYHISNKYFEDSKQELLEERYKQFQKFMEI